MTVYSLMFGGSLIVVGVGIGLWDLLRGGEEAQASEEPPPPPGRTPRLYWVLAALMAVFTATGVWAQRTAQPAWIVDLSLALSILALASILGAGILERIKKP